MIFLLIFTLCWRLCAAQLNPQQFGCWALKEAQFYATNERRVLHTLVEFKLVFQPDGSVQVVYWHELGDGVVNATMARAMLSFELPPNCAANACQQPTRFEFVSGNAFEWSGRVLSSEYVLRAVDVMLLRRHVHQRCVNDALCPMRNGCNGHGTCVAADVCLCKAAFTGLDCAEPVPTAPPAPAPAPAPPADLSRLPRPPLVRRTEYDSDRRCVDTLRDADFDLTSRCTERRVNGDPVRSVAAPLYQGAGWPLDSQLFVPAAAFAKGIEAVDTYMLPPDAYFFADDGGAGIEAPVTAAPTPAPAPTPMLPANQSTEVDPLAGVPLDSADRKLLSAILAVRIAAMPAAPIGVVRNTASAYTVCLRLSETNKPPPPTPAPTPPTTTESTTPPTTGAPVPVPPPVDPVIEFAPPALGAKPLDEFTCIAQLVCEAGDAPAPSPTTVTGSVGSTTATPAPSGISCVSLNPTNCESVPMLCTYDAVSMTCRNARRRQADNTTVAATPAPTPPAPTPAPMPADLASPMVRSNIGRTNCTWRCVGGDMIRGTAYVVHGLRLPYDAVCAKVQTVNTMFVVLRLEPPPPATPEPEGLGGGAIAGIVVGVLGSLALLAAVGYWWFVMRANGGGGGGGGDVMMGTPAHAPLARNNSAPSFGVPGAASSNAYGVMGASEVQASSYNNSAMFGRMASAASLPSRSTMSDVTVGMYGSTASLQSAPSSYGGGGTVANPPPAVNAFKPKFSGPTGPQNLPSSRNLGAPEDDRYIAVPANFNNGTKPGAAPATIVATYGAAAEARGPYGDMMLRESNEMDGKIYGV